MKNYFRVQKKQKMDEITLRRKISIHPSYMSTTVREQVFEKLDSELTGKCTHTNGYVISVDPDVVILNNQIISDGHILCDVEFKVQTLKPYVGQVLDGTACMIFADGIFVEVHKMKVLVPASKITNHTYDISTGEFVGKTTISNGQNVKVKLEQIKYDQRGFNCIGVLT